jgi:hypothetical protein
VSIEGDFYTKIQAAYAADSGAGGLANSTGNQYVRSTDFRRADDADDRNNLNWPMIEIDVSASAEDDAFGLGRARVYGRAIVTVKRDQGSLMFTKMDAVTTRFRVLFHRNQLASSTDWAWSPLTITRVMRGPVSGTEAKRVIEFHAVATRTSGVA